MTTVEKHSAFVQLAGGGYALTRLDKNVRIEFRYLRRQFGSLYAECDVQCEIPGARTAAGSLMCANVNLSNQSDRVRAAKHCAERANTWKRTSTGAKTLEDELDFVGLFDDACLRVIRAEREGQAAIVLDDAPHEGPPQDFLVHGLSIPADSHSQLVADGGGLKSLILLLVLGELARQEIPVAFLDWEWNAARHLRRKQRLFGLDRLAQLHYLRCHQPLAVVGDSIRRFCDTEHIQFVGIDSVAPACDGKLADDDVARAYNRALDDLPPSLAAAHIPKNGTDGPAIGKAFGSAFFHNFARQTYSVKKQDGNSEDVVTVLIEGQKQNDGPRRAPVCLEFTFDPDRIAVRNVDATTVPAFAEKLPLWQRMRTALLRGPLTLSRLAEELGAQDTADLKRTVQSLERTVRRRNGMFTRVPGQDGITRIALVEARIA
jgi:hypothetical protein